MTKFTKEKFAKYANFNVTNCDFESAVLDHNTYDLIFSATAFHWIPEEIGYAIGFLGNYDEAINF